LHLIGRGKTGVVVKKDIHLAMAVSDINAFTNHLESKGVYYENWPGEAKKTNARADGVIQVYLQDPDGYWIEVNTMAR
jgi:catechol 2,3-dioxygenase-like lactoylglutathione lyase family enzyme